MAVADVLRVVLQIYGISVAFFTGMLYCERDMEFWESLGFALIWPVLMVMGMANEYFHGS